MITKKIKTLCLILGLVIVMPISTKAYSSLAESYNYPAKVYRNMTGISNSISNLGYSSNVYSNTSAYYVRRTMANDGIFYISTHGYEEGGRLACYDSSGNQTSQLSANSSSITTNYSLQALFGNNSASLSNMKLAYYSACESARTSPSFGNLLDKTTSLGAQCSIGFYNTIETYPGNDFDNAFFSYAVQGYDVLTSLSKALNDVRTYNGGNAGNLDSYVVSFKSGVSSTLYLRN